MAGLATRYPANGTWSTSAVIYQGDCGIIKRWDFAAHLIINVLGTCILAASNYCMQTLVAPTREEVDAAHACGRWLDIGGASVKNLRAIGRNRLILWIILMLTASLFHLMYNSMIFESLSTNEFGAFVAPKDLNSSNVNSLTTPMLEKCFKCPNTGTYDSPLNWDDVALEIANENYERYDLATCSSFSNIMTDETTSRPGTKALIMLAENLTVSDGGNASILTTDNTYGFQNQSVLAIPFFNASEGHGASSECQTSNTVAVAYINLSYDPPEGYYLPSMNYSVKECLMIKARNTVSYYIARLFALQLRSPRLKVAAMFFAARVGRTQSPPLLTVGDAMSSFLSRPDPTTKNMCWMSHKDVSCGYWKGLREDDSVSLQRPLSKPKHWFRAAPSFRWIAALLVRLSCLCTAVGLFASPSTDLRDQVNLSDFSKIFSSNIDEDSLFTIGADFPNAGMLTFVMVANLPQLLVTMSYYCYNAVLTSMLAAAEYSSYELKRKALRVTWPIKGSQQQSTYWLSIPYRYSIPILILYTVLHWMISQTLYYLSLIPYTPQNTPYNSTIDSLVCSPTFALFAILVGAIMLIILGILAFRRLKSSAPVADSCSAAISAACHPPTGEDLDIAVRSKVKWGQTTSLLVGSVDSEVVESVEGHCSFTSLHTVKPTLTKLYA
ncbi:hypothetical protein N7520_002992 [Penicillium odoratum]|uniref:uncharacterized protein n=1 Tax=Penicillium odoratum TaxID=1167516 RepID=UPI0025487189|nr:uncharacterized protein N7520_002992 [Penicillium odoratum]KAJ5772463.1 hypothetical protein N7520_002992 [Penicillium odoratum]